MLEIYRAGGLNQGDYTRSIHDSFERVLGDIFPHQNKDLAIGKIEDVLRRLTYPGKFGQHPLEEDRKKVLAFFDQLHEEFRR